jgi:spermidine/putrescine transport system ATP-binding protein
MDLQLDGVSKAFGGVPAVDKVSLEVEETTFFSLLGPSGCGKTTVLKMIAGFVQPDQGAIYIRGDEVSKKPPYKRNTSMVFQNYALFPHLSVFENVAFGLRYRGASPAERKRRVGQALEQVRLSGHERRYPSQLSGGQQQRVAFARAIVTQPALLLLDEPLSNLDLRLRQQMRQELINIQKSVKITTVYVTHDQGEAFSMSDKLAIMNGGKIVQIGSPQEIFLRPNSEFVVKFVGETNAIDCRAIALEHDEAVVKSDDGLEFRAKNSIATTIGSRLRLYFREEQVQMVPRCGNGNCFPGVVIGTQYFGAMLTYTIRLSSGRALRSTTVNTRSNAFALDQSVYVQIDPEDCLLVPVDSSAAD